MEITYITPTYFGRKRSGTISVKMTSERMITPEPPIPWITLPMSIVVPFCARQQTRDPVVKSPSEVIREIERPKMSLRLATNGMMTAQESR